MPVPLTQIYAPVADSLEEARAVVRTLWCDALRLVPAAAGNTPGQVAEGKLLRPALCLLTAGALGRRDTASCARLAAAYEAIHIASLTHDDVVDHAYMRRGQNALNALWSDHAAILGGDYLVARALELLTEYDSSPLVASALRAMRRMAEGELRFFGQDPDDAGLEDCLALAEHKTASLFAAACSAPALLYAPEHLRNTQAYGTSLGVAFQLIDDLLDLTRTATELGKPACGDVVEGKHTAPLFFLRQGLEPEERARLNGLRGASMTEEDAVWVRSSVRRLGVDQALRNLAERYIGQALEALVALPQSPWRSSMEALARFVTERHA